MTMWMKKGFATLTITSILLVIALGYSLSSYRSVYYQIKVANNEIQARQEHWQAEGGLECGYSHIIHNDESSIPSTLNTSCNWLELSSLGASLIDPDILLSQSGNSQVNKAIHFSSSSAKGGAIKSTSDLVVNGSTVVSPPAPGPKNSDDEYECVAAVVSNYFIASGVTNKGVGVSIPKPSADFDNSSDCAPNHKTESAGTSGIWQDSFGDYVKSNVGDDFQRDDTLNPFKDQFGYERGEWEQARDDENFSFLSYTMTGGDVDCVSKFKNDLVLGEPNKIWIDGSCQLNSASLTTIQTIQSTHPGTYLFLLFHNGVVGINGAGTIDGVLFQFNNGYVSNLSNWGNFDTSIQSILYYGGGPTVFDALLAQLYPPSGIDARFGTYLQSGAFQFTGGMVFDTQGQIAMFNNSLNLQYNSDISESFTFTTPPKWKQGSWNDL